MSKISFVSFTFVKFYQVTLYYKICDVFHHKYLSLLYGVHLSFIWFTQFDNISYFYILVPECLFSSKNCPRRWGRLWLLHCDFQGVLQRTRGQRRRRALMTKNRDLISYRCRTSRSTIRWVRIYILFMVLERYWATIHLKINIRWLRLLLLFIAIPTNHVHFPCNKSLLLNFYLSCVKIEMRRANLAAW